MYEPGTGTELADYWLATRMVLPDNLATVHYQIQAIRGGSKSGVWVYKAGGSVPEEDEIYSCAIRPLVEIDLSKVNIGATGDGSRGNPYSITAK